MKNKTIVKCILTHINSNEKCEYTEPIYTKLNGMYGYLTVSLSKVHFIWSMDKQVNSDDVSDMYKVEYMF